MSKTALLLIDIQKGLDDFAYWGERNNPQLEANVALLLARFRTAGKPVIHVKHHSVRPTSPLRPGQPGHDFKPEARPLVGEPVFGKTVNSAFIGTDLESYLHQQGIGRLVVAGLTTDHCVSTTVRMAGNLGFEVWLVGDACAAFARKSLQGEWISAEQIHRVHLASLDGEFCAVVSTQAVSGQEPL
ncbi:cysteine hydrolase family protein [uncultured Meiothermus sp.]|jgi:nicotinamidase-related amidase|uniref:cysteine hydrolase family protein n=1 Tax=uncultured Meiothermus sp. TaxID=157471 RepID=UPI0026135A14|nr:cysteine hydrolase family protein [uncultured Meiothermus sp.]